MSATPHSAKSVLVLGDICVDILARVEKFPRPGDDCLAPELDVQCGGVAANCAVALARWDLPVRLLGCVGRDAFGNYLLRALEGSGVDVRWVQRTDRARTGIMYTNITPDGQRTFFGSRAANGLVERLANGCGFFDGAGAAHLVGYNFLDAPTAGAAEQILETVHARGDWVSLDIGMAPSARIPEKILQVTRRVDILFVSLDEAEALVGARDPEAAFAALERAGARDVVLKLGKRGCLVAENGERRIVPSFSVRAVDSTGAGDAFVAAFLQARLRGWTKIEAALAANAAGAAAACVVGAGENLPGAGAVGALLREQRLEGAWDAVRARVLEKIERKISA